jgi:hypothetical protein
VAFFCISGSLALDAEAAVPSGSFLNANLTVRDAGMAVLTELTGDSGPKWIEGRADVKLRAEGTVAEPSISGSASLSRARLQVLPFPQEDDVHLVGCSLVSCWSRVHACPLQPQIRILDAQLGPVRFCSWKGAQPCAGCITSDLLTSHM